MKTENIPETSVCRFHPSLLLCSAFHAALYVPGKISIFSYQGHTVLTASTRKLSCIQEAVCSRKQRIHSAHLHSKYKLWESCLHPHPDNRPLGCFMLCGSCVVEVSTGYTLGHSYQSLCLLHEEMEYCMLGQRL